MSELHPAIPLLAGAAILAGLRGAAARAVSLIAPALSIALLLLLPDGARPPLEFLGFRLTPLRVDALSRVFSLAFAGFALIASIYSWGEPRRATRAAGLLLAASGVGTALAGDLFTLFAWWEGLTVGSLFLIWTGTGRGARDAGLRYLYVQLTGASCLLAGIAWRSRGGGGLEFGALGLGGPDGWLILAGFAMHAAVPPLHAWLPDAYPRSSPAGTVFLSAYTTKAGVYALARGFAGEEMLIVAGAAMALYGVVFAVLENDIRRLLAYHIVSQVGYMVCGVGLGTALAIDGTAAHAFCHIFYKGLLLMAAGAVVVATGRSKLTELGGLGPAMPATLLLYAAGAFSISGVPLFNGFISKSMIVSASDVSGRSTIALLLTLASMGTFLSLGLKLPWFTFFSKSTPAAAAARVPAPMIAAMGIAAAVCVATGVAPSLLYGFLPGGGRYEPFTADHVTGTLQLLVGTALVFWLLRAKLGGHPTVTRDMDRLYRRPAEALVGGAARILEAGSRAAAGVRSWSLSMPKPPSMSAAAQVATLVACVVALAAAILALS